MSICMPSEMNQKAHQILSTNHYMTLATTSQEGQPWSTPVFYAYDEQCNFYWYSRKDTRHSLNINKNSKVSASIFGTNSTEAGIGIYIEGTAAEILNDELTHALETYAAKGATNDEERKQLTTKDDFLGDAPIRMYKLVPSKIYISAEATKWNGKWIDSRSEIEL